MAQPPPYVRFVRYSDYQASHPQGPAVLGSDVDTEFDRIKATSDAVLANLALVQRDDGSLHNAVVTPDALSPALTVLLGGWNPRGAWTALAAYAVKDFVTNAGANYVCFTAHTAGASFSATNWIAVAAAGATGAAGAAGVAGATGAAGAAGVAGATGAAGASWTGGETYAVPAITSNVLTIDCAAGTVHKVTVSANINSMIISNPPAGKAFAFLLELFGNGSVFTYAGLGAKLVAAGGIAFPTITSANGKKDVFACWTDDGGTTWNYVVVGQNF